MEYAGGQLEDENRRHKIMRRQRTGKLQRRQDIHAPILLSRFCFARIQFPGPGTGHFPGDHGRACSQIV